MKPIAHYLEKKGLGVGDLVASTALGVATEDVSWDEVQCLRGNGPQCGRST